MFAVVKFLSTDEVEVVPCSWLRNDKDCMWPTWKRTEDVRRAISAAVPPDNSWQKHPIVVLKKYSSYGKARSNLRFAEDTSNLESDVSDAGVKRPRLRARPDVSIAFSSGEEDEGSTTSTRISDPPPVPYSPSLLVSAQRKNWSSNGANSDYLPTSAERRIIFLLEEQKRKMGELENALSILSSKIAPISATFQNSIVSELTLPTLPLSSQEMMEAFEQYLSEDANLCTAIKALGRRGGRNLGDVVRSVMCSLITNELATKYNWAGRGGKKAFRELACRTVVLHAVRESHFYKTATTKDVEEHIKLWLKHAGARNTSGKKINENAL